MLEINVCSAKIEIKGGQQLRLVDNDKVESFGFAKLLKCLVCMKEDI